MWKCDPPGKSAADAGAFIKSDQQWHQIQPSGRTCLDKIWQEPEAVYIEVKDDGVGIDPEDQKRVFERFSGWTREEAVKWAEPDWDCRL